MKLEMVNGNDARLQAIVEAIPDCVKIVSSAGNLTFINEAGLQMIEAGSLEEISELRVDDFISPEFKKTWADNHKRVCNGETLDWQFELVGLHGTIRYLETHSVPISNPDGTTAHLAIVRDVTDRKVTNDALLRNEIILRGQTHAIELAVHGTELSKVLDVLTLTVEQQSRETIYASILLLSPDGKHLHHGSAPSLPKEFNEAINGIDIGPDVGSCGTAAYTKQEVFVPDLSADPKWKKYTSLAADRCLKGCWSVPVLSSDDTILAAFVIYYSTTNRPPAGDRQAMELLSRTAGIVIEWLSEAERRRGAESALQESSIQLRAFMKATSDVIYRMSSDWQVMTTLDGRNFLANTGDPIENWQEKYIPENERKKVSDAIKVAIQRKDVFQMEHRVTLVDGTTGWTFSRAIPILDNAGEIIEWFGTATDITEGKRAEEALRVAKEESDKRKRLYETITGSTPDLIYVFDLDYKFSYANEALLTMWGKSWGDSIGKRLLENGYEMWHAEMHEREIDEVVQTKKSIRGEVSFPHATLGRRIYDYIFVPVFDESGNVEAVAGTTRDITELKMAEISVKESEAKFRRFYESNMLPIAFWNIKGQVYECNDAFARLVGYGRDEITNGKYNWYFATTPEFRALHETRVQQAVEGQEFVEPYEVELVRSDGNRIYVLIGYTLLEGSTENGVAFLMDITIHKSLMAALELRVADRTKELNLVNAALQQSNEDLLQFAHVASHDLKEPVRKIKTFGFKLQEELHSEHDKVKVYLDKILASATRMASMIDGVLAYSSINSLNQPNDMVDLNSLLTDITSDLEVVIQQKHADIAFEKLPIVEGNKFLLYQLFYNLFNNSLKFTKPDVGPVIRLTSEYTQVDGNDGIHITIKDNGIGFDQSNAHKIFETFTRLNSKDKYEGTGLGLALCKKIVYRHNGTITARSEKGKGAEFNITLPLKTHQQPVKL